MNSAVNPIVVPADAPVRPALPCDAAAMDTVDLLLLMRDASPVERDRLEEAVLRRFTPMTRRLASRYAGHGTDVDDLIQVADLALVKAMRRFDPERGAFESYAKATISGELKRHLRDFCWSIKPPRRIQEMHAQIQRSTEDLAQADGSLPGTPEIAGHLGSSVSAIGEALAARSCFTPASLDEPLGASGRSLGETVGSDDEPFEAVDNHVLLLQLCRDLTEPEMRLIELRFYDCLSQREIADILGVSQMQVSRNLARLLDKLRDRAAVSSVA